MELVVYRCYDCKVIVTDYELSQHGSCPRCRGNKVSGASPHFLELVALQFKVIYWTLTGRRKWSGKEKEGPSSNEPV
jgi:uncharacterized paraquat-inducible protein A